MLKTTLLKLGGVIGAVAGCALFIFLPTMLHNGYVGWQDVKLEYLTDASDIFEYEKIAPVTNPNSRTTPLKLNSYVTWYSGGWNVTYNDVLRCGTAGFISSDTNTYRNNTPAELGRPIVSPWQFNGALPPVATQCYIQATIEVCNQRQVCNQSSLNSDPIYFE